MFEATTNNSGEETVLTVKGEVDIQVAPDLWKVMQDAFGGARSLKIELKDVSYIDSSGIATLLKGLKYANDNKIEYAILDPSPQVLKVIELAHLHTLFSIEHSG